MNVLIVGAGAMGGLFGVRLTQGGVRVQLIDTDPRLVEAIRRDGLVVEELDGSRTRARLAISERVDELSESFDLVVIMVKAAATRRAVSSVRHVCHSGTLFLSLQNGIGHGPAIAALIGPGRLLLGTTAQGATLVAPGLIRHGGRGPTHIGCIQDEAADGAQRVVDLFNRAGLETHFSDRIQQHIWQKLLINVGINAITALAGVPNGWIAVQPNARALAERAVAEAVLVARGLGVAVPEQAIEQVLAVAEATAANHSSMLQDFERKRATEIDAINGAIVRYGEELAVPTPVNWVLTQLIRLIEEKHSSEVIR